MKERDNVLGIPEGIPGEALWFLVGTCLGEGNLARALDSGSHLGCLSVTYTGLAALALQSTRVPLQAYLVLLLDSRGWKVVASFFVLPT